MEDARLVTRLRSVAANVRRLREKQGMTQEQLAETAGMELRSLQRIETGRSNMSLGAFLALADALGVAPGVLLRPAVLPEAKRGRPKRRPTP